MRAELVNTTDTLVQEIHAKGTTRDDVAMTYAMALSSSYETDWVSVNSHILDRWSLSALRYIKEKAWKLVRNRRTDNSGPGTERGKPA